MYIEVKWTATSEEEAKKMVERLLELKLIACAHINPKATALYLWRGKVEEDKTWVVYMKSFSKFFPQIVKKIEENGQMDVPEIICFEIKEGSEAYLCWLKESLS